MVSFPNFDSSRKSEVRFLEKLGEVAGPEPLCERALRRCSRGVRGSHRRSHHVMMSGMEGHVSHVMFLVLASLQIS